MTDQENWYFRNRSRDAIASMFRAIRQLQLVNDFNDSEIVQVMGRIYRETDGNVMNVHLAYLVRELRRDEKRKRSTSRH